MVTPVAQIGTGNVGRLALRQLISDSRFELTSVCVSSPEKVGKDAGELAGLDVSTRVLATDDLSAALATKPDCAVYCAMGDARMPEAMGDCQRILEAGVNLVGSAPVVFQYPWKVLSDKFITPLEHAANRDRTHHAAARGPGQPMAATGAEFVVDGGTVAGVLPG